MVFESIKSYFIKKKQPEKNWFLVELKNDRTMHIVDQKMVEIMLADANSLQELMSCGWTKNLGWHDGNDGLIYERHELNDAGNDYYNRLDQSKDISYVGPKFVKLLNEINEYNLPDRTDKEKTDMYLMICWNFKKNNVKSIKKYERKEMAQTSGESGTQEEIALI